MMGNGNDFLAIERGKIGGSTIVQVAAPFPCFSWNHVRWEMALSPEKAGLNILELNGVEVIGENGMNLPNAQIFANVGSVNGIDFTLQDPVFYKRIHIGATGNPTANDVLLFVDNVWVSV